MTLQKLSKWWIQHGNFYKVMKMQVDILNRLGVPINVAEGQLNTGMKENDQFKRLV